MRGRLSHMVLAVARLCRLVALTVLVTPLLLVRNLFGPTFGPRVLRSYFEACGGGYVKIGQLLATRYDLLRVEYTDELGKLLDSLRPVPTAKITAEIERALGRPVTEAFASFEAQPLATASLAQVHGAVLPNGDEVVVKVLKPRIGEQVRVDVVFLRLTARALDLLPVLRGLDVSSLMDELARTAIEELDLGREAMYTAYIHEQMAADPIDHYAPRVYRGHSNRTVLTLERIRGVTVREMLAATTNGNFFRLASWSARGITPRRTAVILLRSVLEQTMRYRSFNADPHPSNLIVSDGGTLNWVDFGSVGWIDERQWDQQMRLRDAIAHEQIHGAYLAVVDGMEPLPYGDLSRFEQEIKRIISDFLIASRDPSAPLSQKSTGAFLLKTLAALRRNRLPMTSSTVQLYRTILIADIVMLRLYPTIDWRGHLRRFLRDLSTDLLERAVWDPATSPYAWYRVARAPMAAAETAEWVMRRLPDIGRQTLRTLSSAERMIPYTLRLFRRLSLAAVLGAIGLWAIKPEFSGEGSFSRFLLRIEDNPWPVVGIGLFAVLVFSNLLRSMEGQAG
jgi:ubiquinone biosynthesis protein